MSLPGPSAKICAILLPHERQAPIIRPATEGGDCEAGRLAEAKNIGRRRYLRVSAAEARSFCTLAEDPAGRVVPATGKYRVAPGERGEGPRHLASAPKSQHNYPAKAPRAVGDGVGQPSVSLIDEHPELGLARLPGFKLRKGVRWT